MNLKTALLIVFIVFATASCSAISSSVRREALPSMPFGVLIENAETNRGRTVILGGYILETRNNADKTVVTVLQTPLGFNDEPRSRDLSEGRFTVFHMGFLDPEIYRKDRRITVAGTLSGMTKEKIGGCPFDCLALETREIYLWPEYDARDYPPPFYYYDPFFYDPFFYYPYSTPFRTRPFYPYRYYPPAWW